MILPLWGALSSVDNIDWMLNSAPILACMGATQHGVGSEMKYIFVVFFVSVAQLN
jgi:hypothetical protein